MLVQVERNSNGERNLTAEREERRDVQLNSQSASQCDAYCENIVQTVGNIKFSRSCPVSFSFIELGLMCFQGFSVQAPWNFLGNKLLFPLRNRVFRCRIR